MSEINIRIAKLNDADRIYIINKESLLYDFPLDKTKLQINKILKDDKNLLLVSENSAGFVTGYIQASIYECAYDDTYVNIMALAVDKQYHKNGYGKRLLSAVEAWAKQKGAIGVRLESSTFRLDAHKFYEACGYKSVKEHKNFKKIFSH